MFQPTCDTFCLHTCITCFIKWSGNVPADVWHFCCCYIHASHVSADGLAMFQPTCKMFFKYMHHIFQQIVWQCSSRRFCFLCFEFYMHASHLSADDLADAYHGAPNIPTQLNLCVVAIRNPHSGLTDFYISRTHLFGLAAAVVNFNGLPEFMTAVCRRIRKTPSWHFFDDQGTLDFEDSDPLHHRHKAPGMGASELVGFFYEKIGRPFKSSKHLPPAQVQTHPWLQGILHFFGDHIISLIPKPCKFEEMYDSLKHLLDRHSQQATFGDDMILWGKLILFLLLIWQPWPRGSHAN